MKLIIYLKSGQVITREVSTIDAHNIKPIIISLYEKFVIGTMYVFQFKDENGWPAIYKDVVGMELIKNEEDRH